MDIRCYQHQVAIAIIFAFVVWRFVVAVHIANFKRFSRDEALAILTTIQCNLIVIKFITLPVKYILHQPL